MEGLIY